MGMLTTGTTDTSNADSLAGDDATKSMYHDYLTNPNSTYAQDPSLAAQLKSATAPGVAPGSLSGAPATVAKQGLTSDAYNKTYASDINRSYATNMGLDPSKTAPAFRVTSEGILLGNNMSGAPYTSSTEAPTSSGASGMMSGASLAPATMQTYKAAQTEVTPNMLAAGNLASITDPNSQLMVQAATAGNQQANKRGLQNSSIGISAAQDSMLRAATPIAQQDASTQAGIAQANTGALNQAGQFNAGAANTATLTAQQLTSQQTIAKASNDTQIAVARMSADTQQKMAEIQQTNQKLLQSNSQAATAMSNYSATVANIQASKDMGEDAKQQAVDAQLTNLRNTLAALQSQSGQDLSQFFPMLEHTASGTPDPQNLADLRGY